ncbi:MAG: metal-dependent transcriptional regulator [Planctomycetota bacterium]|jgi:DtxR family Mn-dependent transcriptional regulator
MSQVKPDQHSIAVEDYIKHIWKIQQLGERATTKALAERMGLGRGTVSGMLKQLASRGLVEHTRYYGAELTEEGRLLALRVIRRHRLIELFLVQTLGLGWDEVDQDAERLEHAVSERLIERIDEYLGHPIADPHGAPIPSAGGAMPVQGYEALANVPPGTTVVVSRVSDSDPEFLRYLRNLSVALGSRLKVVEVGPFGTMQLKIGRQDIQLPREATQRIFVSEV